jgi:Xaa-Pro aminopeptidase
MESIIPSRFISPDSVFRDFDPEEIECLRYTGRLVRSSLSRAKRSARSPHAMLLRQRQIESAFNEQLIRHDLHSAGLRYDRRAI